MLKLKMHKEKIKKYLQKSKKKKHRIKKLLKIFKIKEKEKLIKILNELEKEGIIKIKKREIEKIQKEELIEGKVEVKSSGVGFLLVERGKDIFIPPGKLHNAMDGDIVKVKIKRITKRGPEGEVVKIIKKGERRFTGTLWKSYRDFYIEPDDRNLRGKIYPVGEAVKYIPSGNKVGFILLSKNRGKVIADLGEEKSPLTHYNVLIFKYNLPEEYPKEVIEDKKILRKKMREEIKRRKDFTNLVTFTIDPYNAKDFDDAISAYKRNNFYELFVHIADVSFFVPFYSPLFEEAFKRGNSYYLLEKVIPMLPPVLSEDLCSLSPNRIRLAKTVYIILDFKGNIKKFKFYNSVIKSDKRLDYETAQDILDGKKKIDKKIERALKISAEISEILKKRRRRRYSLDFDLPEPEILFTNTGKVDTVRYEKAVFTHSLIEECMILANRIVAKYFSKKGIPFIYRIHEEPDPLKLKELSLNLKNILKDKKIITIIEKGEKLTPKDLSQIIDYVRGKKEEYIVIKMILRAMKQARYSIENIGHYGLSLFHYTHFTSPIRRLVDLTVHHLLNFLFSGNLKIYPKEEELDKIAKRASETERIAQKAEWDIVDMKILEYLKEKLGEEAEGIVVNITESGLWVFVPDFFFEGFVSFETFRFPYRFDSDKKYILIKKRKKIEIGSRIKVKIERIDIYSKMLFLVLAHI